MGAKDIILIARNGGETWKARNSGPAPCWEYLCRHFCPILRHSDCFDRRLRRISSTRRVSALPTFDLLSVAAPSSLVGIACDQKSEEPSGSIR